MSISRTMSVHVQNATGLGRYIFGWAGVKAEGVKENQPHQHRPELCPTQTE